MRQSIAAGGEEAMLLAHLVKHGQSTLDDLEVELAWDRKRVKRVRHRPQQVGAALRDDSSSNTRPP